MPTPKEYNLPSCAAQSKAFLKSQGTSYKQPMNCYYLGFDECLPQQKEEK